MTNPDLNALAEQIKATTGPDRELDVAIGRAVGAEFKLKNHYRRGHYVGGKPVLLRTEGVFPRFTASIDAAMSLVDPRALWAHGSMEEGPFARLCWPQPDGGFVGGYHEATAATVPLAICAAALRARAQSERTMK